MRSADVFLSILCVTKRTRKLVEFLMKILRFSNNTEVNNKNLCASSCLYRYVYYSSILFAVTYHTLNMHLPHGTHSQPETLPNLIKSNADLHASPKTTINGPSQSHNSPLNSVGIHLINAEGTLAWLCSTKVFTVQIQFRFIISTTGIYKVRSTRLRKCEIETRIKCEIKCELDFAFYT